jgi:hypothetical protein
MIEQLYSTFDTGNGFWNPLVFLVAFFVIFLIIYILRGLGNESYKKHSSQTQSFLSGNEEYDKQQMHVKSSNLYWGWTEAMQWFIQALKKIHTGNISDYVLWFVIVIGILFITQGVI